VRVSMFRRGRTWWARYGQDGRDVRRSLKTENRKVAQDLLLELQLELRRGSQPRPKSLPAMDGSETQPQSKMSVADFKREFEEFSKSHKRPK